MTAVEINKVVAQHCIFISGLGRTVHIRKLGNTHAYPAEERGHVGSRGGAHLNLSPGTQAQKHEHCIVWVFAQGKLHSFTHLHHKPLLASQLQHYGSSDPARGGMNIAKHILTIWVFINRPHI